MGEALSGAGVAPRIVRLPVVRGPRGEVMSYVQVLPLGPRLLVPDYTGSGASSAVRAAQATAHERLAAAFPGLERVSVPLRPRAELGGGLHCYAVGLP